MQISKIKIGFIGFGHMAQIIFQAIRGSRLVPASHLLFHRKDPSKAQESQKLFGITSTGLESLVEKSDLILVCVRPHQAEEILKKLAILDLEGKFLVSILAGVSLSIFKHYLGDAVPLLRVLPNVGCKVGQGVSVLTYGSNGSVEFRSAASLLFGSMGQVIEIEEKYMDLVCGISGSGPGFVFRLIESMARWGEKGGLSYSEAIRMAAQTFLGAAELVLKSGDSIQDLIQQIATPNGTTQAGLNIMNALQLDLKFQQVLEGAAHRSAEISQELADRLKDT